MINPWVILGVVIAWLGSVVSVGYWQNGVGKESERVLWQARENKEVTDSNDFIIRNYAVNLALERQGAQDLNKTSIDLQEKLKNEKAKNDYYVAGVRNGTIILRQPVTRSEKAGGSISSEVIASASGRDGETGAELSRETAEFLLGESERANQIVQQLTACQDVIVKDRKLCGVKNDGN